jgi:prephenate dehydrogenase
VFASISILATGLLGASVARAVRSRGLARTIKAWSRRVETRAQIKDLDWCDEIHDTPEAAVAGCELVVICSPVDRIIPLVEQIKPHLAPGCLVTDVGSVKSEITRKCSALLQGSAHFVGSHPMAGSDRSGHEHSDPDLFRNRPCVVTPLPETDEKALGQTVAFWRALDADVITESPEEHDEIVAHISHLPHVLASTLCSFLASKDERWRDFSSTGLRDTTRVAGGDPELWRSILEQNRDEVLRALRGYEDELHKLQAALTNGDFFAAKSMLERGRRYRADLRA